jgi:hypothetical protein
MHLNDTLPVFVLRLWVKRETYILANYGRGPRRPFVILVSVLRKTLLFSPTTPASNPHLPSSVVCQEKSHFTSITKKSLK